MDNKVTEITSKRTELSGSTKLESCISYRGQFNDYLQLRRRLIINIYEKVIFEFINWTDIIRK
jgi:hypothetical protein